MSTPTLEDALKAAEYFNHSTPTLAAPLMAFLESLTAKAVPEAAIANDSEGFIVEGAYQSGFDWIDDDAKLLIVHQNDLIKFAQMHRQAVKP